MPDIDQIISPRDVLDFWFGAPGDADFGASRAAWFSQSDAFDEAIKTRFGAAVDQALEGGFEDWRADFDGALALIILLDQFPRNIHRGTAKMYAGDIRARAVSASAMEIVPDAAVAPVQRLFLYLPFEHSEEMPDQEFSVQLFRAMPDVSDKARWLDYAIRHQEIIARFGRFPHRNEILARPSTPEEHEYLQEADSGF